MMFLAENLNMHLIKNTVQLVLLTLFLSNTWNASAQVAASKSKETNGLQAANNDVLARIDKAIQIEAADILSEVNKMQPGLRAEFFKRPENIHQVVNNLIVRRYLAKKGEDAKLFDDRVVQAALNIARDRVMSDAQLNKMDQENEPNDSTIEAYAKAVYQANIEKYESPAQTRASHILIEKKEETGIKVAEELLAKIKNGANFEELAKEHSKDPGSAVRGGDLGYFGAGRMVPPFDAAVNKLSKIGDISPIVESQFGYHIIRLDDRKPKTVQSFEEVKDKLSFESRAAILTEKRIQEVKKITSEITFEKDAIVKLSKEAYESLTSK
jgi:peptidyl-prolyl cis-trans isomerase C